MTIIFFKLNNKVEVHIFIKKFTAANACITKTDQYLHVCLYFMNDISMTSGTCYKIFNFEVSNTFFLL